MSKKLILATLIIPLSACQTISDYSLMGISKQRLDKGNSYTVNDFTDREKNVDLSLAAMKPKNEISGTYIVERQWNRYLKWNIQKINIKIMNGSVVADLYAKDKSLPFYGLLANDCTTIDFAPNYDDPVVVKRVQKLMNLLIKTSNGLLIDMKACGDFQGSESVIEYKAVKKGYTARVFESNPIDILNKWGSYVVPEDGYIITLRDKKIRGGWQDKGSAEITVYAKKLKMEN